MHTKKDLGMENQTSKKPSKKAVLRGTLEGIWSEPALVK